MAGNSQLLVKQETRSTCGDVGSCVCVCIRLIGSKVEVVLGLLAVVWVFMHIKEKQLRLCVFGYKMVSV